MDFYYFTLNSTIVLFLSLDLWLLRFSCLTFEVFGLNSIFELYYWRTWLYFLVVSAVLNKPATILLISSNADGSPLPNSSPYELRNDNYYWNPDTHLFDGVGESSVKYFWQEECAKSTENSEKPKNNVWQYWTDNG